MSVKIAFLRGVNITGHNKMKMTDLTEMMHELGFRKAFTYIQSGNVVFSTEMENNQAALIIGEKIRKKFGYDIKVMVRDESELREILVNNPFPGRTDFDPSRAAVIFLNEQPDRDQLSKVGGVSYPPDEFVIIGKEIFIYCPNGFARSKIYSNFFENRMKVTGTARNLNTLEGIMEIVNRYEF